MSTVNKITVNTIRWDLQTRNIAAARSWQDQVSLFSQRGLPSLIETSLERLNPDDEVITIDALEIDLGNLKDGNELEEKIRRALQDTIAAKLSNLSAVKDEVTTRQRIDSLLEQFRYYLLHGHLPWNSSSQDFISSQDLFQQLVLQDKKVVIQWMKGFIQHEAAVYRLIEFFAPEELDKLLFHLVFNHDLINTFHEYVMDLLREAGADPVGRIFLYKTLFTCLPVIENYSLQELVTFWWNESITEKFFSKQFIQRLKATVMRWATEDVIVSLRPIHYQHIAATLLANFSIGSGMAVPVKSIGTGLPAEKESKDTKAGQVINLDEKHFFVENAGIVLLYPYLKAFFRDHGLVNDDYQFNDRDAQLNACYWLQLIAGGMSDIKEYHLVLPKALCGYPLEDPVSKPPGSENLKVEDADDFLKQVIVNWSKIKTTSAGGFRGTFLLRPGKLSEEEYNWLLRVERRGWDVLLESLPYPLSVIKLPWMNKPLYVQW